MSRTRPCYVLLALLLCFKYSTGRDMHQAKEEAAVTARTTQVESGGEQQKPTEQQAFASNRKLANAPTGSGAGSSAVTTSISPANSLEQTSTASEPVATSQAAGTDRTNIVENSTEVPVDKTQSVLTSKAPMHPMPAAVPFKRETPTYRTYSMELGASINGTAFIPGACGPKPSALGYQCSWPAPDGVILHWSYNVTHPPVNRCTRRNAVESVESQNSWGGETAAHFALQAASQDKLHFTFVDPAGRYLPSEGVHGWGHCTSAVCNASTPPEVEVLYYDAPGSYSTTGRRSPTNSSVMEGWASWVSADFDGLTGVLCFSRKASSKTMKAGANILYEAEISYAVNNRASYTAYAKKAGTAVIDFRTGKARKADLPMTAMAVHGALMIVAFAVMLPAGLLMVRHKWLFIDEEYGGGPGPLWALTHMVLLVMAAACAVAGMIVALVAFGNNETGMLMSTHQVLGLISVAMTLVLVVIYGLGPLLRQPHKGHNHPLLGPQKISGLVTVLAGWTSLFLGCAVVHYSWAVSPTTWVTPCAILVGLVAAAGTALELRYAKLVRLGIYNPKTQTINNIAPLPLARIRTGREPVDTKKQEFPSSFNAASRDGSIDLGTPASARSMHSTGIGGAMQVATAALNHRGPVTQIISYAQRAMSMSSSGGSHSPGAGSENLVFRRGRQSSNASGMSSAGAIVTGFPGSPAERNYTTDNC